MSARHPISVTTAGPEATFALGQVLAPLLDAGDVVLLAGDLGAGKTVFVQGLASGLGIEAAVTSPTFALIDEHRAPSGLRLLHVDVYRLDEPAQVIALGLGEEVDDGATVAVVEWGEKARAALPGDRLEVLMSDGPGPADRMIELDLVGPGWEARRGRMILAVAHIGIDVDADDYRGLTG